MIQWFFQEMVSVQRDIYLAFGERIKLYAETGDWSQLAVFLPMGILFGAVHAMTPGHSKTLLAVYSAGTNQGVWSSLRLAFILSAVHISMSVFIVLFSLPLVSFALGSAGRSDLLEGISRGLIGLIGLWMIWSAFRPQHHPSNARQGSAFAVFAGLIPCPLTLFVMTFAVARGVTEAGIAFAFVMLIGVAVVLSFVAVAAMFFRKSMAVMLNGRPGILRWLGAALHVGTGLFLIATAFFVLTS